ncbi:MAG: ABC transporter permease [Vicinamibacterales bacterium]|jgi:putative ABC transport system permease protein|nr:ABC transporter permease [Vicinamibacterales bacterium]HJN46134.1 ABC transporter permease [Vicinamibacterales bacterium]
MTGLWRRCRELFQSQEVDRESVAELEQHIALAVDDKRRGGVPEQEARRQARLELGSVDAVREQLAEHRSGFVLEQLVKETAYAWRVLRRAPGPTALSVVTIGVGIAASTVLFAVIDGVVLRPLPYPEASQLVSIVDTNPELGVDRTGAASGNIDDWRRQTSRFEGIAGFYTMGRTLSAEDEADVVLTAQVSTDFFPLARVTPLLGRTFTEDETLAAQFDTANAPTGSNPVVIIGHELWRQRFGGDAGIVDRTVMLERRPFRVVGVMPAGFALPEAGVQAWMPWDLSGERPRDQHYLGAMGRLAAGASIAQAEDDLNRVAETLARDYPDTNRGWRVRLNPLATEVVGDTAGVLWMLFAAVGLVLLVACANVALLSVMRGLDRSVEHAVRLALGSTPGRLLRQSWIESLVLALVGGALGVGLALGGLRVIPRFVPDLPRLDEVALGARALWFAFGVTSLAALLSGVLPAWRGARTDSDPARGLRAASLRFTASAPQHRVRDALVIGQVALALVLLCGSGLLVRSFVALRSADPGFDPGGVLVAPIFLDAQAYGSGERARAYYDALFTQLEALPGVEAVGAATTLPTSPLGPDFARPVWPDGVVDERLRIPASVRMVTPGYFDTLRLEIAGGRAFDARDHPDAPPVVMVSETLAARLWPGQSAVGESLVVDYSTAGTYPYEVVGVVGDVRFRGPRSEPLAEIYLPHAQRSYLIMNVAIRGAGDPRALIPAVRSTLREVDPQKPAYGLTPLEDLVGATMVRDRQAMVTLLAFAVSAVFLAMLGVYGVLSARVRERHQEIGVRMALGADTSQLIGWVAASGMRLLASGAAIGLVATWPLTGLLSGLLFGVQPTDAVTAVSVVVLLGLVGITVTLVPSWRATRVDPVAVLRRG